MCHGLPAFLSAWSSKHFASRYAKSSALARAVHGFQHNLWRNGGLVPNYARRRRAGEVISTAFVESLVDTLLSKRLVKKQSVQCTPRARISTPDADANSQR
jgi:hypothetical protein